MAENAQVIPPELLEKKKKLISSFPFYSRNCLRIKTKKGEVIPFEMNAAQKYVHERLEEQKREKGYVRAIVLKGRQQGISTYIQGRYTHKTTNSFGTNAFILTHEDKATQTLFDMGKRYYDNLPIFMKPKVKKSNEKALNFGALDSGYAVGTAGNRSVGRSMNNHLLHGCLAADSLIIQPDGGSITMGDIQVGDEVITSSGATAKVKHKIYTGEKQTYAMGCWISGEEIYLTADHKVLTSEGYKKVSEITTQDFVAMPDMRSNGGFDTYTFELKNKPRPQGGGSKHIESHTFAMDYDFGYFIGYYLAEGHVKENLGYITMTYADGEDYINQALKGVEGLYTSIRHETNGTRARTHINGKFLAAAIDNLCGRVAGKHIPYRFFDAPVTFLEGVLKGYFDGDGSKTATDKLTAPSIHERIARQIQRIFWATYGACSISKHERERYGVKSKDVYLSRISGNTLRRYKGEEEGTRKEKSFIREGVVYCRVKHIKPRKIEKVWDIEVDHDDHNYQTSMGMVSNSEVAFWPNAAEHAKGIMQTVGLEPGTEIILESTANGMGNYYHQQWKLAEKGLSDFIAIFVPWFWEPGYRRPITDDFQPTDDELELKEYYGLDDQQLCWRRAKIVELSADGIDGTKAFKQEYPCIVGSQRVGTCEGIIPIEEVGILHTTSTGVVKKGWLSGTKETIEVITSLGYRLECTLDHRIARSNGEFVEANRSLNKEIRLQAPAFAKNPYVMSYKRFPCSDTSVEITKGFARFLGFFMGDGSYSGATLSVVFDKKDCDSLLEVKRLIKDLFDLEAKVRQVSENGLEIRVCCKDLKPIFNELGIIRTEHGNVKRKVCVPECIWRSPKEVVREFLRGLFDADGFAGKDAAIVKCFSRYPEFMRDVQLLLLGFGITCRVSSNPKKTGDYIYEGHELTLRSKESRKFMEEVGFFSQRKQDRVKQWPSGKIGRTPKEIGFVDTVAEINPLGMQDVYDIEMLEEPHVFDAQGILVHNCNPVEAFQVTGGDGLISDDHVLAARKNKVNPGTAFYVGVDPSRGGDRFALIRRSHRKAWGYETYTGTEINTLGQQVAVCKRILDTVDPHTNKVPDMMFIDAGGGSSLVDRLHELGYEKRVKAIPFGGAALNPDKYSNKRNEMWGEMNLWFRNEDLPVEIPDSDELHADLLASPFKRDSNDRICLLAKEDIIKKFGFSPDGGDALALTFTGHKIEDNWQPPKVVKRNRSATRFDRR